MIKETNLVTLVSAALIATVVRLFLYLVGVKEGSYLRDAIGNMGVTVVLLEVCIVILRFFTAFQLIQSLKRYIPNKYELIAFTAIGMSITFLWTTVPGMIMEKHVYPNDAVTYLTNRPFEPIPILVEYTSLYLLHNNILSQNSSLAILCMAIISVIIAISDVKGHGNTIVRSIRNQSAAPKSNPQLIYQNGPDKILGPKEPSSLDSEDL